MATFNLKIDGLQATINNLKKLPKEVERVINDELNAFGFSTVADAKRLVPVYEGFLINSINYEKKNLAVTINVSAFYAAMQEFGTRRFAAAYVASLPADWQQFAAQFKGKGGGSFDDLVIRLVEWVKRKGLHRTSAIHDAQTGERFFVKTRKSKAQKEDDANIIAYLIAKKIMVEGIKPQPFLFPAVEKNIIELKKNLKLVK